MFKWVEKFCGYAYVEGIYGSGSIDLLDDGRFRWEAHSINETIQMLDYDGWWGIEQDKDLAKKKVEIELLKHYREIKL